MKRITTIIKMQKGQEANFLCAMNLAITALIRQGVDPNSSYIKILKETNSQVQESTETEPLI